MGAGLSQCEFWYSGVWTAESALRTLMASADAHLCIPRVPLMPNDALPAPRESGESRQLSREPGGAFGPGAVLRAQQLHDRRVGCVCHPSVAPTRARKAISFRVQIASVGAPPQEVQAQ